MGCLSSRKMPSDSMILDIRDLTKKEVGGGRGGRGQIDAGKKD